MLTHAGRKESGRETRGFESASPSKPCKRAKGAATQKPADMYEDPGGEPAETNSSQCERNAKEPMKCLCVYLSRLRPGFGGRGSLKSSRLTPCSAALSPAPRTHGRAQSRSHRTWWGEGGEEEEEEEEEMEEGWDTGKKKQPDVMSRKQNDPRNTYR